MHVVFELTNYQPAICVLNMYALCVTARKNQKATTTRYAPVLSAKHASFQGGAVIVKCANPAFTRVEKGVNDSNYIKYPTYVRAYHS